MAHPAPRPHSRDTLDRLVAVAYDDLREVARRQLALRAAGSTLSTTGLVHEAYLRLAARAQLSWNDRPHFFALSALAMRHVLLDRARARLALKRETSARPVTFDEALIPEEVQPDLLLALSEALDRLAEREPRLAQIVDCRFFGGFTEPEIAEALGVNTRTVQRDWAKARMLLRRALER